MAPSAAADVRRIVAPFVEAAAERFPLPPPLRLICCLSCFPAYKTGLRGQTSGLISKARGSSAGGFLPFPLTGDYWAVLVKRRRHNSKRFPTFFFSFFFPQRMRALERHRFSVAPQMEFGGNTDPRGNTPDTCVTFPTPQF